MSSSPRNRPERPSWALADLRLLHLADSALPIGSLAHSQGIESLASRDILTPRNLKNFFRAYIEEAGILDAVFCREGWRLGTNREGKFPLKRWRELNDLLSALKPAREAREASASLGENFLRSVLSLGDFPLLKEALESRRQSQRAPGAIHHSPAFGLASAVLEIDEDSAALAFLHQSVMGLVSACQRLMALGQRAATRLIWELKPSMTQTAERSRLFGIDDVSCFLPLLECGSMEHPALTTRLFIS
jgi:urease accessory protein